VDEGWSWTFNILGYDRDHDYITCSMYQKYCIVVAAHSNSQGSNTAPLPNKVAQKPKLKNKKKAGQTEQS